MADPDFAARNGPWIIGLPDVVLANDAHLMRQQMAFLEDSADVFPLHRGQRISKIEAKLLLHVAPRAGQALKPYLHTFSQAYLAAKPIERGDYILQRIADQMFRQLFLCGPGEGEFFSGKLKILGEDLNRIVYAAVGAPPKHAVDCVAERAIVADDVGFEFFLAVILNGMPRALCDFQAQPNAEDTLGLVVKLHGLHIFEKRVRHLPDDYRFCVLDLFLGTKRAAVANVATIRTMARCRTVYTGAGRNLEISQTFFDRTFAAQIAIVIRADRDAELIAKSAEIVCIEATHSSIHAVLPKKVKRCCDGSSTPT